MILVPRIDQFAFRLSNVRSDGESGYVTVDGTASLVGVLEYGEADGAPRDEWFEFVPRTTLSSREFLDAMRLIPVTLGHPAEMLDATNTREHQRGVVTRAWMDGDDLRVTMRLMDSDVISAIRAGVNELSLGYHAKIDETPGSFRGQSYNVVQDGRIPNHLAVVDRARAGHRAKVDKMDAARLPRADGLRINTRQDQMEEVEIEIGGQTYKVPQAVADVLSQQRAKIEGMAKPDEANGDGEGTGDGQESNDAGDEGDEKRGDSASVLEAVSKMIADQEAKFDKMSESLADKLDERQKRNDQAAQARAELVEKARPVLANSYKFDGKSDEDISRATIVAAQPDWKPVVDNATDGELPGLLSAALIKDSKRQSFGGAPNFDSAPRGSISEARAAQAKRREDAGNNVVPMRREGTK